MIKHNFIILLFIFLFNVTPLYSQVVYSGSIREQIERWEGKNSENIIDYVLKLQLQSFEINRKVIKEIEYDIRNNYFIVIRTEINGWGPVEYQITLRNDYYAKINPPSIGESKLMLIFEHPVNKSIHKQYDELLKAKPDITLEEAASKIKMKQDTALIDSTFKYFNLINEMFTLELPVLYDRLWALKGTWSQVYIKNFNNEHYGLFQFGSSSKYADWVARLFKAMIDNFNAIDPYPDIKWKEKNLKFR